jgi:hypothetical protein
MLCVNIPPLHGFQIMELCSNKIASQSSIYKCPLAFVVAMVIPYQGPLSNKVTRSQGSIRIASVVACDTNLLRTLIFHNELTLFFLNLIQCYFSARDGLVS